MDEDSKKYNNRIGFKLVVAPRYGSKFFKEYRKGLVGLEFDALHSLIGKVEKLFNVNEENRNNFSLEEELLENNLQCAMITYSEDDKELLEIKLSLRNDESHSSWIKKTNLYTLKIFKKIESESGVDEKRFKKFFKNLIKKDYEVKEKFNVHKYDLTVSLKSNNYKEASNRMKQLSRYFLNYFRVTEFPKYEEKLDE